MNCCELQAHVHKHMYSILTTALIGYVAFSMRNDKMKHWVIKWTFCNWSTQIGVKWTVLASKNVDNWQISSNFETNVHEWLTSPVIHHTPTYPGCGKIAHEYKIWPSISELLRGKRRTEPLPLYRRTPITRRLGIRRKMIRPLWQSLSINAFTSYRGNISTHLSEFKSTDTFHFQILYFHVSLKLLKLLFCPATSFWCTIHDHSQAFRLFMYTDSYVVPVHYSEVPVLLFPLLLYTLLLLLLFLLYSPFNVTAPYKEAKDITIKKPLHAW